MSEQKLPRESKSFSLATSRIAAFYLRSSRLTGERLPKLAVHHVGHTRVHLTDSVSHRGTKQFAATRYSFWARSGRGGLERPRFFVACAPKKVFGVIPAHTCARKVSTMQMDAISIP